MKTGKIYSLLDRLVEYAFYALVFFVPLFLTKWNYELFEYNKMMLTYGLTILIVGAWVAKMVIAQKVLIKRTPFDIPICLFFLSQLVSFALSMDRHVSFWGYYSRFHGGLLSTITYITLYYALVSNFIESRKWKVESGSQTNKDLPSTLYSPLSKIKILILVALSSATIVSIYGIFEHFGSSFSCLIFTGQFDVKCWVQDVQNRVFATLGQPNWLAAYMAVLVPIGIGLGLGKLFGRISREKTKVESGKWKVENDKESLLSTLYSPLSISYFLLSILFYLTLLYTKSRSGYLGFWFANAIFWFLLWLKHKKAIVKPFIICHVLIVIIHFFVGSPFEQLNSMTWKRFVAPQATAEPLPAGPVLESGGTESGSIRRIVWQGAWDIARDHPLFGTGVETFAYAYYKYRPLEHNLTSEWDFLYNKAHNEYLNYAATTGFIGLGAYLLLIVWFIVWNIKSLKVESGKWKVDDKTQKDLLSTLYSPLSILHTGLFSGWLSILVTNFFGFSVVVVALFFWLIPALLIVSTTSPLIQEDGQVYTEKSNNTNLALHQKLLLTLILLSSLYSLVSLFSLWQADAYFAEGYRIVRTDPTEIQQSYQPFTKAIAINPSEPLYHDEFSYTLATLALAAHQQDDATLSGLLSERAIAESDKALVISPDNVNFWKTRTRVMYVLGQINNAYYADSLAAIQKAQTLAPNDAKIAYNVALLFIQLNKTDDAMRTLKQSLTLKSDYREPRFALAQLLQEQGRIAEAKKQLEYILQHINPEDKEVRERLEQLH